MKKRIQYIGERPYEVITLIIAIAYLIIGLLAFISGVDLHASGIFHLTHSEPVTYGVAAWFILIFGATIINLFSVGYPKRYKILKVLACLAYITFFVYGSMRVYTLGFSDLAYISNYAFSAIMATVYFKSKKELNELP